MEDGYNKPDDDHIKEVIAKNLAEVEHKNKILGTGSFKSNKKYVCFLPYFGEFGWYIMIYCKRFHAYDHSNKIVFIKPGHECLFPTANYFEYNWNDIPDNQKAGIIACSNEELYKLAVINKYGDDVHFVSPHEAGWDEKTSLSYINYVPVNKKNNNLKVDIVITPRKREIDSFRNWWPEHWQHFVNRMNENNISVGVCGHPKTSFDLAGVKYKSSDYTDIDSDVELMHSCKLVITQESGLLYLAFLCKKPVFVIDHYQRETSDVHRNLSFLKEVGEEVWTNPERLVTLTLDYLENYGEDINK